MLGDTVIGTEEVGVARLIEVLVPVVIVDEFSSFMELFDDLFRSEPWLVRLVGEDIGTPVVPFGAIVGGFERDGVW